MESLTRKKTVLSSAKPWLMMMSDALDDLGVALF
jgi:hypothetical protein